MPDEANPQRIETLDKSPLVSGTATSRLPLDRQFAPASGMIARGLRQRNITEMCRAVGDADGSGKGQGFSFEILLQHEICRIAMPGGGGGGCFSHLKNHRPLGTLHVCPVGLY